ncbi:hypothetical protein LK542_06710 [Massilia sp. IC2-477]|uniref:hypothetical protein n=1 Tax=Massilia sp. IC2-477 TaxID=2887198 RepID=UPI001D0FDF39|nr:hypothetical protein [Massilia sp. IC2-477]MCC2955302.1 hypothetical protein [Massilia sp. IC2-477]
MRYHLPTLAFFAAAAILYYFGLREDAGLMLLAGGVAELLAWKRLFKRRDAVQAPGR